MFSKKPKVQLFEKESKKIEQLKEQLESQDNLIAHYKRVLKGIQKNFFEIEQKMIESDKKMEILEIKYKDAEQRRINATAVAHRRKKKLDTLEDQENG